MSIIYIGEFDPPTIADQNALQKLIDIKKDSKIFIIPINELRPQSDSTVKAKDVVRDFYCNLAFKFSDKVKYYKYYKYKQELTTIKRLEQLYFQNEYSEDYKYTNVKIPNTIFVTHDTYYKYYNIFSDTFFYNDDFIIYGKIKNTHRHISSFDTLSEEIISQIDLRKMICDGNEEAYKYIPKEVGNIIRYDNVYNPAFNLNESDNNDNDNDNEDEDQLLVTI